MASGPAHRPHDRTQTAACLLLAAAVLAFSLVYSAAAPLGRWENQIFGTRAWGEADPGVWYVFVSHEPWEELPPRYPGHPGTPLVLLLNAIQRAGFAWAGEPDARYAEFTARHLPQVLLASKLLATCLHLLSFVALYAVTCALASRRTAFLATLGYASSLPTLYYLSRVSPEPLMVGGFALSLLSLWRYEDHAREGRSGSALAWVTLAGAAATTAAVGKLSLSGPLPFALVAAVASDWPGRWGRPALPLKLRASACGAFTLASLALLAFYSRWIDWAFFLWYWRGLADSPAEALARLDAAALRPGLEASRLFPVAEAAYLAIAAWGVVAGLRDRTSARPRYLLVAGFAALGLVLFVYRILLAGTFRPFHYSVLLMAALAPFFGAAVAGWERRLLGVPGGARSLLAPALVVLCIHGVALVAVVDSRRHDTRAFAPHAEAWEWIGALGPGEQLVVERILTPHIRMRKSQIAPRLADLTGWPAAGLIGLGGPPPRLQEAFSSLFRPSHAGMAPREWPRLEVRGLGITLVRPPDDAGP